MKEFVGNMWRYYKKPGFVVLITTNGTVRNDGHLVMGAGCALEAMQRISGLAKGLGTAVKKSGNKMFSFGAGKNGPRLLTFPVKHNWYEKADLKLIRLSASKLNHMARRYPELKFVLPRPGCGNGGLKWETVKPLLKDLPENVLVISRPK